jgi:hypothetical protein
MIRLINADASRNLNDAEAEKAKDGTLLKCYLKNGLHLGLEIQELGSIITEDHTIIPSQGKEHL